MAPATGRSIGADIAGSCGQPPERCGRYLPNWGRKPGQPKSVHLALARGPTHETGERIRRASVGAQRTQPFELRPGPHDVLRPQVKRSRCLASSLLFSFTGGLRPIAGLSLRSVHLASHTDAQGAGRQRGQQLSRSSFITWPSDRPSLGITSQTEYRGITAAVYDLGGKIWAGFARPHPSPEYYRNSPCRSCQ